MRQRRQGVVQERHRQGTTENHCRSNSVVKEELPELQLPEDERGPEPERQRRQGPVRERRGSRGGALLDGGHHQVGTVAVISISD